MDEENHLQKKSSKEHRGEGLKNQRFSREGLPNEYEPYSSFNIHNKCSEIII